MVNVGQNKDKGARFARIPTGIATRTFCLMLVSRGAVYHTRKSAGEFKHFHWGCDCKVVPSFEDDPDAKVVEDVRPKELHEQWKACKCVDDEISAPSLTKAAVKRQLIINPAASLNAPPELPFRCSGQLICIMCQTGRLTPMRSATRATMIRRRSSSWFSVSRHAMLPK